MSKSLTSTVLHSVPDAPAADRLLDDCALDQNLGVLRRSIPRTYAWRVQGPRQSKSSFVSRSSSSLITSMRRIISTDPLELRSDVGRLARHAALTTGFVAAVVAIFVSIMQQGGATAHAASGLISFATVSTVTLLMAFPALHLLVWFGVDLGEFVSSEDE